MQISTQVIEILEYLGEKFGIAIDWTQANVMPYVEQLLGKYIQWEIATSWLWVIVFGALLVAGVVTIIVDCVALDSGVLSVGGFCGAAGGIGGIIYNVYIIVTCYYFPEMQIINYLTKLLQST